MRKEWRRWGARLMAGIMIATSVWMPVHADVAVAIPAEGKYTTEITEYEETVCGDRYRSGQKR